jgi:NAD(P)-dependent dehydrogenase (short-subunit alcohol dehydrogenase family)
MRAALVTGAGKRLGRAMALHLARRGLAVAVHYNGSEAAARETVAEIERAGGQAAAVRADLFDEEAIRELLPHASEALGRPIDTLINNASYFRYDRIGTLTRESWDRHMLSNLRAPVVLTEMLAGQAPDPEPDENGEPVACALVVNMVDQRVRKLTPHFMSYTLAKSALWTFTQTAAQALAPRVRVNAIGPGPTMRAERQSEDHFRRQRRNVPLERGGNAEDIVAALDYFVAARAVTGQLLCVDGGQHLGWRTPDIGTTG